MGSPTCRALYIITNIIIPYIINTSNDISLIIEFHISDRVYASDRMPACIAKSKTKVKIFASEGHLDTKEQGKNA